jgi:hypothetical protein
MAFPDKTGKMHHSASRARFHDTMAAEKSAKPAMEKPTEKPAEKSEESSDADIKDVVAEHGPAHEVHMEHDHEAKHSKVTSHHGEHKHEKHFDGEDHVQEAHDHAHEAAGGEDEEEPPDEELGEEMAPAMEEGEQHSRIPGMA